RLGPVDDATAVTAARLRGVVERLITAGQWRAGDPDIVIVSDAGYDVKPPPTSCGARFIEVDTTATKPRRSSPTSWRSTPGSSSGR
ncbi:hypothetical protein, partial [Streptomyces sp. NPDC018000]|uniref:hypothetical protein n=1 Tax=Streptomyces sp. NPDC018000 TaxID=3365028 RepID=UPI0037B4A00F